MPFSSQPPFGRWGRQPRRVFSHGPKLTMTSDTPGGQTPENSPTGGGHFEDLPSRLAGGGRKRAEDVGLWGGGDAATAAGATLAAAVASAVDAAAVVAVLSFFVESTADGSKLRSTPS